MYVELTPLERSEHIAEWVRLTDEHSGATCATKPGAGRGSVGGVRAATRELGIDRTEAQRAVKNHYIILLSNSFRHTGSICGSAK